MPKDCVHQIEISCYNNVRSVKTLNQNLTLSQVLIKCRTETCSMYTHPGTNSASLCEYNNISHFMTQKILN